MTTQRVTVTSRSARVSVRVGPVDGVSVVGASAREVDGGLEVDVQSRAVEITVPIDTDIAIGVSSGRVDCEGQLGAVSVNSRSGRVVVAEAREVDVRTTSGSVVVGRCHGMCRASVKSGTIHVGDAGTVEASTISGRIEVDAADVIRVNAVSGTIKLGSRGYPDIVVRTVSGSVRITVPSGTAPASRISALVGSIRSDCVAGNDGSIAVSTTSGSIRVAQRR